MDENDQSDWDEFSAWMAEEPSEECLYIWLRWENGTFVLDPSVAQAKAFERFETWRKRKHGIAAARAQLRVVGGGRAKSSSKIIIPITLDLSGLKLGEGK